MLKAKNSGKSGSSGKSGDSESRRPSVAIMVGVCSLVLFGLSVSDVLQNKALTSLPRDLDVVELWSGTGTLCDAARNMGLATEPFDKIRVPGRTDRPGRECEDILHKDGFMKALKLVMRLKPKGLLWQGVQCSSFVFADSSNCKRKRDNVQGDLSYQPVVEGNAMANAAAFFMVVCVLRGVQAGLENPAGSQLFEYVRSTTDLIKGLCSQICHRCAYDDGPYPRIGPKPYKFLCTGNWIHNVKQKCSCPVPPAGEQQHQKLMEHSATGGVSGTSKLKTSAAYPKRLGRAIVTAWSIWRTASSETLAGVQGVLESKEPKCASNKGKGSSETCESSRSPGVLESKEPESDSSNNSPPWADSPIIDAMDKGKFARPRTLTRSAKRRSQHRPDSDSNGDSPAWAESPEQPQASKGGQTHPPKRKCQRRPKSNSSSGAWSESMG